LGPKLEVVLLVQNFKIAFSLLGPTEWAFSLLVDLMMRIVSVPETKCFNFHFKPRQWMKSKEQINSKRDVPSPELYIIDTLICIIAGDAASFTGVLISP